MPLFIYMGPENEFNLRGTVFAKGEPVEVTTTSLIVKCQALSCFSEAHPEPLLIEEQPEPVIDTTETASSTLTEDSLPEALPVRRRRRAR